MATGKQKSVPSKKGPRFKPGKELTSSGKTRRPAMPGKKKASKPLAKPAAKSAAKNSAKPAKITKQAASAKASASLTAGIAPINSGRGMSVLEIGKEFFKLFSAKTPDTKIWSALFAKEFTSIEGFGVNMQFAGRAAVEAKNAEWSKTHVINGWTMDGPYCGSTGFCVRFKMDVTDTAANKQILMEEVAFYTVSNGKIVREEFMYLM